MFHPNLLAASLAFLSFGRTAQCATASEWASRSIYQVMTDRFALTDGSSPECDLMRYCGGTWKGIENKLDYIQGLGFSAIQISPVVKNFANHTIYGSAFHGYWPIDWYALNENFGTIQDLKDLAKALHDRDMLFMVDVVINDMAVAIEKDMNHDTVIDYSQFHPFNDEKYYHKWCNLTDWFDPSNFQPCWLGSSVVALPDLKTEEPIVQTMVNTWIRELISNYSIDGLRIDAAKHVNDEFLTSFVQAAGVFTLGEVYNQDIKVVCAYSKILDGVPNFVTYFPLIEAFTGGDMTGLGVTVEQVKNDCRNASLMGTFSENHDLPRFASITPNLTLAMNAVAFTLLAEGIPTMYQLQEHHVPGNYSPFNRGALWTESYNTSTPLYTLSSTLNALRTHAILSSPDYIPTPVNSLHLSPSTYVTRKGSIDSGTQIVAAYFNNGSTAEGANATFRFQGGFQGNTEVVEMIRCKASKTDGDGWLEFGVDGEPKAWFRADKLEGSGLCGRGLRTKIVVEEEGKVNETASEGKKSEGVQDLRTSLTAGALAIVSFGALLFL